jgi:hypothetical protein
VIRGRPSRVQELGPTKNIVREIRIARQKTCEKLGSEISQTFLKTVEDLLQARVATAEFCTVGLGGCARSRGDPRN